jgi:predicted esterase
MISEQGLQIQFNARYFLLGEPGPHIENVWFVCHGYGQLAYYFLKKFSPLANEKILIVAPEGLSRFYLEGFSGRVGATWMTKENRLVDIQNYVHFLDELQKKIIPLCHNAKITLLGFSQGSATVSRWIMLGQAKFDRLILWAGLFPDDLPFDLGKDKIGTKPVIFIYGEDDPYITNERVEMVNQSSAKLGIQASILSYPGVHEINEAGLKLLL